MSHDAEANIRISPLGQNLKKKLPSSTKIRTSINNRHRHQQKQIPFSLHSTMLYIISPTITVACSPPRVYVFEISSFKLSGQFCQENTFSMLNVTQMLKRNLKNSSVKTQSSRAEQEASLTQTEIS